MYSSFRSAEFKNIGILTEKPKEGTRTFEKNYNSKLKEYKYSIIVYFS